MAPEIWIPTTARRRVVDRCAVPTPDGPCGHEFYEDEPAAVRERHIVACVKANADTVVEVRERMHPEIMRPWDPEYQAWLDEHAEGIAAGQVRW